jgi:hypothetical protein
MKKIESLICCGQELVTDKEIENNDQEEKGIIVFYYSCEKCGKLIKIYPNQKKEQELERKVQEKTLVDF